MFVISILILVLANGLALYPKNHMIIKLTSNNFDNLVINSKEIWIVEFFAPWCSHCHNFVPEYVKVAKALNGVIKVGAVNGDDQKDLAVKYGIRGFPTIYIFIPNTDQPIIYNGQRTAKDIVETTLKMAKDKANKELMNEVSSPKSNDHNDYEYYLNRTNIIRLNDTHFDKHVIKSDELWLVNFYAPWCQYCKNFAPVWVKIAVELNNKIRLGIVDATSEKMLAKKYDIKKYPTVKFFAFKALKSPIEYDGEYLKDAVTYWALEKMAGFLPDPEVIQIVDEKSFQIACDEKSLCVFTVLPHIFDCQSECRNAYLNMVRKLGKQFKQDVWGWAWSEALSQPHLEKVLGIGGFGYPALAAINIKKLKYSVFKGSFSEKSLYEFLRNLAYGKETNCNFLRHRESLDVIIVEKWDGKDHHIPVEDGDDLLHKDEL